MSYKGSSQINQYLSFLLGTVDGSGVPVAADAAPTYDVLASDGSSVVAGEVTTVVSGYTGLYLIRIQLATATGFASGLSYNLIAQWEVSSSARSDEFTFRVT